MNKIDEIDEIELRKWWQVERCDENGNGRLTEIRVINGKQNFSGYFTDIDTLYEAIKPYVAYNIYYTINELHDACGDRVQQNRMVQNAKSTTSDNDIIGRTMIAIDLDPARPSDTNATDEELVLVDAKCREIYKFLRHNGFNDPIIVNSGNGQHMKYRCKLAATAETTKMIKDFLESLSLLFSDDRVHVDTSIFNNARVLKCPSSYSRKGSANSKKRPQRICNYKYVPTDFKVNDIEYFRKIAALLPKPEKPDRYNNYMNPKFNLEEFISKHNIPVCKTVRTSAGTKYVLSECPFDNSHKAPDSAIFEANGGGYSFVCFHASCSSYGWREFRTHYDPDAYSYKPSTYQGYQKPQSYTPPKKEDIVENEAQGKVWLKMSEVQIEEIDPANYIPSGIEQLDFQIIGFKRGHVSVWSGLRGSAKSTVFNQLILNAAQREYKSALWTGELDSGEEKTWIYSQAAGKQYNKPSKFNNFYYTPKPIQEKIGRWIDNYFVLFNNEYGDNYIQIETEIRKLHKEWAVDVVILDNLMTIDIADIQGVTNEQQKNFMKMLTKLAKELKIHLHIACHPNKSLGFLRPNSISGSGHIPDLAQNVFILHRKGLDFARDAKDFLDQRTIDDIELSRATNLMEICKCRAKGAAVGTFVKMHYEIESNRLKNEISETIHYGWEDTPVQNELGLGGSGLGDFVNTEFDIIDDDMSEPPF